MLLGDVIRIIVAFTEDKFPVKVFLDIILNADKSKGANIHHYLNPYKNRQSHTAMPVWFSRDDYLQNLTDSQQNRFQILEKPTFCFSKAF